MKKLSIIIMLVLSYSNFAFAFINNKSPNTTEHINYVSEYYNKYHLLTPRPAILTKSYLMLVNKSYYVNKDYTPKNLVNPKEFGIKSANDDVLVPKEVLDQYLKMVFELELNNLYIFSGFRNYQKQEMLYSYYKDDNYSARPGFSEHHTGFALDISTKESGLEIFFSKTKEFQILINNSYKYGFILRYPMEKTDETGYFFEPWHFRYVGKIHATIIFNENISLEQYIHENFDF